MADKEGAEHASRGNEWEVVSLTASTYAASPGPNRVELKNEDEGDTYREAETSRALFMSGHFVFPPNEHENLPLIIDNTEIYNDQASKNNEKENKDAISESYMEQEGISNRNGKDEEDWPLKGLNVPDEFSRMPLFDENVDKEQSTYNLTTFASFHSEVALGESNAFDEKTLVSDLPELSEGGLDFPAHVSPAPQAEQEEKDTGSNLPYEAWWRKRAASVYGHAKEANAFWSIFVAAAVMGIVILGQRWQEERWQDLQHKWRSGINGEKTGWMLSPISRLKDVIVGGHRPGTFIRGSSSKET